MVKEIINSTEKKWLALLYNENKRLFTASPLPSHDQSHHLRVWNFAKEIILALTENENPVSQEIVEKLIIAVFFHDTGLTVSRSSDHGLESRKLCEQFLKRNNLNNIPGRNEMLDAIEKHDDKSYSDKPGRNTNQVFKILAVCDDLDAYGAIGIYRYLDIYLLRKIPLPEIPDLVLENIGNRFYFMESQFYMLKLFVAFHRGRMTITRDFFSGLHKKLPEPIALFHFIQKNFVIPGRNIEELMDHDFNGENSIVNEYIIQVKKELEMGDWGLAAGLLITDYRHTDYRLL